MKPLLAVITYNRRKESLATLRALRETGTFEQAKVMVWDNASQDDTGKAIARMRHSLLEHGEPFDLFRSTSNIGCPRALNMLLQTWRYPGQDFIKVDNDVEMLIPGWVEIMSSFMEGYPDVGMATPWYAELDTDNQGRVIKDYRNRTEIFPIVGHCCYHRGEMLDRTGFFDVLAPDHLYGFEDLLMAHRCAAMGYKAVIVKPVALTNLQRHNSLDVGKELGQNHEGRQEHVDRLRPLYDARLVKIHQAGGTYRVNAAGAIEE